MADPVFDPDNLINVIDNAKDALLADVRGESFEGHDVPEAWAASRPNTLSLSTRHYKHGSQSLSWQWQAGDEILVTDVYGLADVEGAPKSAFRTWVYNEIPLNSHLTFRFGSQEGLLEGRYRYQFTFGLKFRGWRGMLVNLHEDAEVGDDGEALEGLMIFAPEDIDSGRLFFDIVEFDFERRITGKRSGDVQVPFVNQSDEGHWQQTYRWRLQEPTESLPDQVIQEELDAFEVIVHRYDQWMYGENIDPFREPMKTRYEVLQEYITDGVAAFGKLNIQRDGDVITGVPLFASVSPYGPKITRYAFEKCLIPMVMDYRINGKQGRLQDLMDLFDFVNDQGWADGSANGSLDHEQNRAGTYMHAVFMM
ncbi:MAG: chondroitinase family protein, partial [Candidatus Latescibacteria bacterium]|nr:chondroitinase family protein [Candidatus Latescibacterota bacterium]